MDCMRNMFVEGVVLDGRYKTISPLNHGSFGMVFTAQDLVNKRHVAIKCLAKTSVSTDTGLDIAADDHSEELVLHRSLRFHPNIVNLWNSFETETHVFIVMEFCSQGDLYEAIRNGHGPLQTEHVRQFMLELVDAVAYIHSSGVFHRDIKPENIFLSTDGTLKLGDFGLATTEKWSFEMTVGSDRYMAPEQFDSAGAGYSPAAADIWAIGICLLNILFSRNPFTTPTEADPLFLDYSRDKQSLFDMFPAMSQDTYEVIDQCMNLDPKRRSLCGAREALLRVVSFTTEDESLDDFYGVEKTTVTSANREPLRTPSLQAPSMDMGAFPWVKAFHATPRRHARQLSVITDNESYSEDLFSKSEEAVDWCSSMIKTPSMSSVLESSVGVSVRSPVNQQSCRKSLAPQATLSLPIAMAMPITSSMSMVFGPRKDSVSKSWSDMWDEDEEVETSQGGHLHEFNSRTWSHESTDPSKKGGSNEADSSHDIKGNVDDDLVADGFFFQEAPAGRTDSQAAMRYSSTRRYNYDKWAALGERRRGLGSALVVDSSPGLKIHRQSGPGSKSYEAGISIHSFNHHYNQSNSSKVADKQRLGECRGLMGKSWNWRRERRAALGEVEWVGGW